MKNIKSKGFTLIELLVVIAIIGILSSVVLASLNSARLKARDARRISDIKQIQTALELYADSNGSLYPTTLAGLVSGGQMPSEPSDPQTGASYSYVALGTGTACSSYHLGAVLEESPHSVHSGDADAPATGTACTGGGTDFSGLEPMYDVTP